MAALTVAALASAKLTGSNPVVGALLLALAPWHATTIFSGQYSLLAVFGVIPCYLGLARRKSAILGVGFLLAATRPNFIIPVVVLVILCALGRKMLLRSLAVVLVVVMVFTLSQPLWMKDLFGLNMERFFHPRPLDSVYLLPFWPATQLVGTMATLLLGLITSLHEWFYDWVILILPVALIFRPRVMVAMVLLLYSYPLLWILLNGEAGLALPTPVIIPHVILRALLVVYRTDLKNEFVRISRFVSYSPKSAQAAVPRSKGVSAIPGRTEIFQGRASYEFARFSLLN